MEKLNHQEDFSKLHRIWVGEEDRIASFHEVDTYELQTFLDYDAFLQYLRDLQTRGFRFQ